MAKKHSKLVYWLQICLFKLFLVFAKVSPVSFSRRIWKLISILAFKLLKGRRLLTIENIRNARERGFLTSPLDDYHLAQKSWEHLGLVGGEFFYYHSLEPEKLKEFITIEGEENLKKILAQKKGAVMVTGHIGNWELLGIYLSIIGYPLSPLVKTQENSFFDDFVQKKRQSVGIKVIPNNGFLRPIIEAFRRNEIVPFLIDQDARRKGVMVNVFGREASIPPGAAEFSIKTGTPAFFAYIIEDHPRHYTVHISEEINLPGTGNKKQDLLDATTIFMNLIQEVVQKYPEQWLWMHSLWPTKIKM